MRAAQETVPLCLHCEAWRATRSTSAESYTKLAPIRARKSDAPTRRAVADGRRGAGRLPPIQSQQGTGKPSVVSRSRVVAEPRFPHGGLGPSAAPDPGSGSAPLRPLRGGDEDRFPDHRTESGRVMPDTARGGLSGSVVEPVRGARGPFEAAGEPLGEGPRGPSGVSGGEEPAAGGGLGR